MRFSELSFFVAAAVLHGAIPVVAHVVDKPVLSLAAHTPTKAEIEILVEPHALPDLPRVTETAPEPQAAIEPSRARDTPPDRLPPDQAPTAREPSDDPYASVTPSPETQPAAPAPAGSGQAPKDEYDPLLPDNGPGGVLTGPPGIGGRPVWQMPGVLPQAQGPAPAPTTPTAPKPVDRDIAGKVLRDAAGKSDKEKGIDLPAAGTVASAIGGAVRSGETPTEGRATFVVRLSPTGQVLDVRVASASAGSKSVWDRAAQAAAARLRGKTLTMTSAYAAGATVYVDVQSVVTMPSGSKGGIQRQGAGASFDLSDIGANPTRTIRTSFRVVPAK